MDLQPFGMNAARAEGPEAWRWRRTLRSLTVNIAFSRIGQICGMARMGLSAPCWIPETTDIC